MQFPVDVGKLIGETSDIKAGQEMSLALSVYIDESAPAELIAHVRTVFASSSAHVRMTVSYLGEDFIPHPTDDLAILVAGESAAVGANAEAIRAVGVPVMIVTTSPHTVNERAMKSGVAIPEGDVASPPAEAGASEPIEFDDAAALELNERMGVWMASVCYDKRLALSIAFPFMRRAIARESVQLTALENAGIGLIPFIPGADLPLMTLNQAKMALQIAAAYGKEPGMGSLKGLAVVVGGAYLGRLIARELVEFIPVIGFIIKGGVAYGTTAAMGYAIVEYFEGGEDATGVANVAEKAGEAGVHALEKAREIAANPSSLSFERLGQAAGVVRDKASFYLPKAIELASEYAPQAREAVSAYVPKLKGAATSFLGKA